MVRSAACALLLSTMPVAALTQSVSDRTERAFHDHGALLAKEIAKFSLPGPASLELSPDIEPAESLDEDALAAAPAPAPNTGKRAKKSRKPAAAPELSVYIAERRLTELARSRTVPEGRPVPAKGARPAGIALHGVGSYGVGLRDGDVLTSVEGHPVQAEGQVVGIVMAMLARHARKITGEFWRGERRGSIVVDVPIVRISP